MILLAGSTGLVGGMIARMLLEQRRPLRVFVRPTSDHQALAEAGAQLALGDLKDPASVTAACRGIDAVITTATGGQRGGDDNPQTVDLDGNRTLIEAARAAGVGRFIFVSALTASADHPVPIVRYKAMTEATLRESGMSYTVVAANCILDVMFPLVVEYPVSIGRPVTLVGEARRRHTFVAARDVAAFAVAALDHPEAANQRLAIGGPEALSWRDVVAVYERSLGRRIPLEWIAPGELLPDVPPVPGIAEIVSGLLTGLEMFDSPIDMAPLYRTFGVAPTTVATYVASQFRDDPGALASAPNAGEIS